MFTLNSKTILFEALPQINQSGFSRIPIHGDNKDEIVGIIHVRDVLKALETDNKKTYTLEKISRSPIFVSQEKHKKNTEHHKHCKTIKIIRSENRIIKSENNIMRSIGS